MNLQKFYMGECFDGFKWVELHSDNPCVFGYIRTDGNQRLMTILNFSGQDAAIVTEPWSGYLTLDTNWDIFGGQKVKCKKRSIATNIARFSGQLYRLKN